MNNIKATYYSEVGSYQGAIKVSGKWIRAKNLNYLNKTGIKWIRWQGPPSPAIIQTLKSNIEIDFKNKGEQK